MHSVTPRRPPRPRHPPGRPAAWRTGGLALAGLLVSGLCTPAASDTLIPDTVREAVEHRIEADYYHSVIIGVTDGKERQFQAFGPEGDNGPRPDPDTLFEIGSLTKPFTAALMTREARASEMPLHVSLEDAVTGELELPARLAEKVRLVHLATHTAGIPAEPSDLPRESFRGPFEDYQPGELRDYLSRLEPHLDPGEQFGYSNLGYALLGEILQDREGAEFEELLEKYITGPLELPDTVISPDPDQRDRLARGHDFDLKATPHWEQPAFLAASGLKSSTRDLIRWLEAHMAPEAHRHDERGSPGADLAEIVEPRIPASDGSAGMALGWHLLERNGREFVWHAGRTGGHAGFAGFTADGERGVVVLSNTGNSVETLGFATLAPGTEVPPLEETVDLDRAVLALYAGRYQVAPGFVLHVRKRGDHLYIQAPGRSSLRLYPSDSDTFFTRGVDAQVRFLDDEAGSVNRLEMVQEGRRQLAHRMEPTQSSAVRRIASVGEQVLEAHAGLYETDDGSRIRIERDQDRLLLRAADGIPMPLYPADESHFFHRHLPTEVEFANAGEAPLTDTAVIHHDGEQFKAERVEHRAE